ncbi:MBL fold metallo-hydrolase [Endozoicomonadaceae bacterium StTr2]
MNQLQPDLWQTELYSSGMLNSHAYFLTRPEGNVLFYNTGNNQELDQMDELGGIRYQLLTHRDEAGASLNRIRDRFSSILCCSALEAPAVASHATADMTFDETRRQLEDINIFHTPGHTDGSLCFGYQSPHGQYYLFTGDTFFQWNEQWSTFVLESAGGSYQAILSSLQQLRQLTPDLVMSSGFVGKTGLVRFSSREEWVNAIDPQLALIKQKIKQGA